MSTPQCVTSEVETLGLDPCTARRFRKPQGCFHFKTGSPYAGLFEMECDASLFATRGVLLQKDTNGDWHPVAYHLKSLSATKHNYQVYDRELYAIIRCLRDWRCYIYGSPHEMIVWTDHYNLTYYTHPQKLTRRQV